MAVLGACLAGWAALAWAQPSLGKLPDAPTPAQTSPTPPPGPVTPPAPPPGPALEADPGPSKAVPSTTPALPAAGPGVYLPAVPMPTPIPIAEPSKPLPADNPILPVNDHGPKPGPLTMTDEKPEVTVTAPNPTGRQEPAVSLEWVGPPVVKVGQPADFTLVIRNACKIPVQQVLVRVRVPNGVTPSATEPKAVVDNNVLVWDLNTLMAGQEKNLQIKLLAETKGDMTPQAWVTFTGSSVTSFKVREPKLLLKASAPEKVLVGDAAAITLTVSNPGDGAADKVKIHALLSEGLEHARGNKIDFDIGDLTAGDTKTVTLLCATKIGGAQHCEAIAEADGGLNGKDNAVVNVIQPRLDLQLVGPGLRYLERKALYTLKVTNPGDAAATNVTVGDMVPVGFKVLAASDGGRHDFSTRTVSWFLGEIAPGQTREVKLEVQAINPGEHKHKATAVGARGLKSEAELMTRVEGLSALLVEMVDTEDPIEVGGETSYEIRISNTGSKTETDIKLIAEVPDKMEFKNAQGPAKFRAEGKTIVFESIDKLAPRADALFRINVKALEQGTVRFKINVTSTNITEPVIKMEATRIYSDAPEVKSGTEK
jgi:uncharacterized repeat protein (TIGR01451 family)